MWKILIIEDDEEMRAFLKDVSEMLGYSADTAATGREALACVAVLRPALVVQDIMLPDIDGWAVVDHIRAIKGFENVPVVFCSGSVQAREDYHANPPHASAFLDKPFEIDTLDAVLSGLLQKSGSNGKQSAGPSAGMCI